MAVVAAASEQLIRRSLVVALLLSAGCRSAKAPAPAASDFPLSDDAGPSSFAQVSPGDTVDVIALMRRTMSDIDARLDSLDRRDTALSVDTAKVSDSLAAADSTVPRRRITLWLDHGTPMKLLVSEPGKFGEGMLETAYWFYGGELAVEYGPDDACAVDGGRIVFWADRALLPIGDFTGSDRISRETELANQTRRWLGVFGLASQ